MDIRVPAGHGQSGSGWNGEEGPNRGNVSNVLSIAVATLLRLSLISNFSISFIYSTPSCAD